MVRSRIWSISLSIVDCLYIYRETIFKIKYSWWKFNNRERKRHFITSVNNVVYFFFFFGERIFFFLRMSAKSLRMTKLKLYLELSCVPWDHECHDDEGIKFMMCKYSKMSQKLILHIFQSTNYIKTHYIYVPPILKFEKLSLWANV